MNNYYDMGVLLRRKQDVIPVLTRAINLGLKGVNILYPFKSVKSTLRIKEYILNELSSNDLLKDSDVEDSNTSNSITFSGLEVYVSSLLSANTREPTYELINAHHDAGLMLTYEGEKIRKVAEHSLADFILLSPYLLFSSLSHQKPNTLSFDHISSRFLRDNVIGLAIPYAVEEESRGKQIAWMKFLRLVMRLYIKYHFPLLVVSYASNACDMRKGKDLASLAYILSNDFEHANYTTSKNPELIIKKMKVIWDKKRKYPGVIEE